MAKWTIPGNYVVNVDHGADLEISSSHHDFKASRYIAVLEMRTAGGEWLGPKVSVVTTSVGTVITTFDGTILDFPGITFDHIGVQGLLDQAKIITFVSNQVPDPRP